MKSGKVICSICGYQSHSQYWHDLHRQTKHGQDKKPNWSAEKPVNSKLSYYSQRSDKEHIGRPAGRSATLHQCPAGLLFSQAITMIDFDTYSSARHFQQINGYLGIP